MSSFDSTVKSSLSEEKSVFVTVGTTEFDTLIQTIIEPAVLNLLLSLNYKKLVLQIGRGQDIDQKLAKNTCPIQIEGYRFKPNIRQDLQSADLIIGHAGAGTCLESLELNKKLLVVINEKLHDNHQLELAKKLSHLGHLKYCKPDELKRVLSEKDLFDNLVPFKAGNPKLFVNWLDKFLGVAC